METPPFGGPPISWLVGLHASIDPILVSIVVTFVSEFSNNRAMRKLERARGKSTVSKYIHNVIKEDINDLASQVGLKRNKIQ